MSENGADSVTHEKISGIFSTQTVEKIGTGTTTRKAIQKTYWWVQELDKKDATNDPIIEIQPLNVQYVPSGPKREIAMEDFLTKFNPEPEFYQGVVFPRMQELSDTITRGERHRAEGRNYSAEFEFKRATAIDEGNVRANFGLGLTYLSRGDRTRANDIFERLVKLDAAFELEHKHLFNDFGINLRKNKMFDQALEYYLRAEELAQNDENLFHNIARVYFEKGELARCVENLKKSLRLNPDLDESRKFWDFLDSKGYLQPADKTEMALLLGGGEKTPRDTPAGKIQL